MTAARDQLVRFWPKVNKEASGGCWEWTAAKMPMGYGRFDGKLAHRLAYELLVGPIPDGLVIDHLCRNKSCVNPGHLEPVQQGVNLLRGETVNATAAGRTECIHGHPFTESNTHITRSGRRTCRRCNANRQRELRQRRKAS